jgi:hypothetical protein
MTLAVATQPRRQFILEEGEQLLVTRDALVAAERLTTFVETTGIAPELLVADPVTAIPLPIHARGKRFDEVHPDALWNPLFWLPEEVALRFRIRETEYSEPRPETDAEWALRIALELAASGLYTPDEGWLDVFALYGIDADDPDDLAAVQAWQAGLPDERLDSVDLRQHARFTEANASFETAQELYPLVMAAQWGYTASSLLVAVEADRESVALYAAFAADMLSAEPSTAPDQLNEASEALNAGGSPAEHGPKVVAALNSVLSDYAAAIYELERL